MSDHLDVAERIEKADMRVSSAVVPGISLALLSGWGVLLAMVQVLTIAASLAEINISRLPAAAILIVSVLVGAWTCLRLARQNRSAQQPISPAGRRRCWPAIIVASVAAIVYMSLWVLACSYPDMSCDGNTYHIPGIHIWAMKGHVHWIDPTYQQALFMNGYPKAVEVMSFVLAKAIGSEVVAASNLVFLPLAMIGGYCLTRCLGGSRGMATLAGAAMVLIPANISQANTTYVDSGFASCATAYMAFIAVIVLQVSGDGARIPWAALPGLGATMGLVAAAKGTGALMSFIGLIVLAVCLVARMRAARRAGQRRPVGRAAGFLLAAVVLAVVVGGFWHIRNWTVTGNPIYPVRVCVAGHTVFPGRELSKMIGFEETAPSIFRYSPAYVKLLYTWTQFGEPGNRWPDTIWFLDSRLGGLGYLWLVGCCPAILAVIVFVRRRSRQERWALSALLAAVLLTFLVWPMNWWARYTVWLYALGLPCLAVVAQGKREQDPLADGKWRPAIILRRCWLALCILVLLSEGLLTLTMNVAWARQPAYYQAKYLLPSILEEPARPRCWIMPEVNGSIFDEILTGKDSVAVGRLNTQQAQSGTYKVLILGALSQPIGYQPVLPLPDKVDEAVVLSLKSKHVRYVIWDDALPQPPALADASKRICYAPGFVVFVLR